MKRFIALSTLLLLLLALTSCQTSAPKNISVTPDKSTVASFLDNTVSVALSLQRLSEETRSQSVTLRAEGVPAGYRVRFEPETLEATQTTATMTVQVPAIAEFGLSNIRVVAQTAAGITGGTRVKLRVGPQPYNATGPYAEVLTQCAFANYVSDSCTLTTLPLIGQEKATVTKADVMNRLIVSHPWMAENFSALLDEVPADMLQLFGAVTAVVISKDIRPSYYTTRTAAIYLDPASFWLSNEEKQTIDKAEDYRTGYGNDLKYRSFWRYTLDNDYAYRSYSLNDDKERTLQDILYRATRLLYHELGHANDYASPSLQHKLDSSLQVSYALANVAANWVSIRLTRSLPLQSTVLLDLGQVHYHGEEATLLQKQLTAQQVGVFFEPDRANEMYSYSSIREDAANLIEVTMMRLHYGIELDTGFVAEPTQEDPKCDDYKVGWGMRNKLAQPQVKNRARFVVEEMLGNTHDWDTFFSETIGEPQKIQAGKGWCSSVVLGDGLASQAIHAANMELNIEDMYPRNDHGDIH